MSKFNVTVPGRSGQDIAPDAPVEVLQQGTPQVAEAPVEPTGSLDDLLQAGPSFAELEAEQAEADLAFDEDAIAEARRQQLLATPEAQQQRQREQVTPIHQRKDEERVDRYEPFAKDDNKDISADFGFTGRAKSLINKARAPEVVDRVAVSGITPILNKVGTNISDPAFLTTVSYTTENFMADLASGQSEVDFGALTDEESDQINSLPSSQESFQRQDATVSKAKGNQRLGQQIHREYQRYKNAQQGLPTDQYTDLSPEEATVLGDAAKELYYEANKDNMARVVGTDRQVYFVPSPKMLDDYSKGSAFRKRYFPQQKVRPTKAVAPEGRLVGEGLQAVRGTVGKVGKGSVNDRVMRKAAYNMHTVPNVVDKQRSRILLSTILPALQHQDYGNNPLLDTFAEINNFGPSKIAKFKSKQQLALKEGDADYSWQDEMAKLKSTIAQSILGIAQERNGANHLTYYMQAFNGRLSVQQSHFDPTTSKAVRFVTRNAVPVTVNPGSRQERNLIQMYSLIIGDKGTDALLPAGRVEAMTRQTPKLEAWGKRLNEVLNNSASDADVEAAFQAIENGVALNDPNFPQVKPLALDPQRDAELIEAIRKKGEDGPAFIDGLIDFAKYQAAKRRGAPHYTYFNAYIDGKTNGIASNGIQMGSKEVAMRTGVLRSADAIHAVDQDIDIRDEMMTIMSESIKQNGFDGQLGDLGPYLYTVAEAAVNHRQLAKDTTMTFGYGKMIESFKEDIKETVYELAETMPEVKDALDILDASDLKWQDAILSKYAEGLEAVMSKEALEARHMMWGVAAANSLADTLMTMTSYTGLELRFGEDITAGEIGKDEYKVYAEGTTDPRRVTARHYDTRATAAATRSFTKEVKDEFTGEKVEQVTTEVGGRARGGAIPGPVQSLDAATVALTASGKSWKRLKDASKGNPYIHSIYDAFKMDANGYDVILEEVNKNWLDAAMEWSYLKEAKESLKKANAAFNEKLKGRPDNEVVSLQDEFLFIYDLLDPTESKDGDTKNKLMKQLNLLVPYPPGMTSKEKQGYLGQRVEAILSAIDVPKKGIDPVETLTVKQIKKFHSLLMSFSQLESRLNKLIDKTEHNKKKLKQEIMKDPESVYQYYTH